MKEAADAADGDEDTDFAVVTTLEAAYNRSLSKPVEARTAALGVLEEWERKRRR